MVASNFADALLAVRKSGLFDPVASLVQRGDQRAPLRGRVGLFEVVIIIARIRSKLSRVDVKDRAGDRADEMHVVADKDERALVLPEGLDQRIDA